MSLSTGEILVLVGIAVALTLVVAGYMIYSRRKGWM